MWIFWLTCFSSVFLAGSLSPKEIDTAFTKCWEAKSRTLKNTDFAWYSSSVLTEVTTCIEKSIYNSDNLCDPMTVKDINLEKLNNALGHFCSKFDIQSCRFDLFKKDTHLQKHFDANLKSYAYCIYDRYDTCNKTVSEIIKRNQDGIEGDATHVFLAGSLCDKEIDDVLKKCWTHIADPFSLIKKYGKGFYDNVTKCVENGIHESEHLNDQAYFQLCSRFDVVSCQEDYYTKDYGVPKSVDELLTIYANCVYDKYSMCDTTLEKIIKYYLVGIKNYNTAHTKSTNEVAHKSFLVASATSDSAFLSNSFILIVFHIVIILSVFI